MPMCLSAHIYAFARLLLVLALTACSRETELPLPDVTTDDLLERGQGELANGTAAAAISSFRMVLHRDSLHAEALAGLAQAYRMQGKRRPAARYMRRAVSQTYAAGLTALHDGDSTGAATRFRYALRLHPKHPLAPLRLGELARAKGDLDKAIELFQQAIEVNPEYSESFLKLGDAYAETHRPTEAREAYERAIELNINTFGAYMGLGRLHADEGAWSLAADNYGKALLIQPGSTEARAGAARARQNL
ncbi:tetratricopeptide repeat protein [Candidatus Latescibacterota bacterium]